MHFDVTTKRPLSTSVEKMFLDSMNKVTNDMRDPYFSDLNAQKLLMESFDFIYDLVGAKESDDLQFFSSEEEAAKELFTRHFFKEMTESGKNFIATLETENRTIREPLKLLEAGGATIIDLPCTSDGHLSREILESYYSPKISMLALSWVDPFTGVVQPMFEIADFCNKHGIILYVQANEIFGKIFFRFQDLPIDYLSFEGYRMGAPDKIAALFSKSSKLFRNRKTPLAYPYITALAEAARESLEQMDYQTIEMARLTNQFEQKILEISGVTIYGKGISRIPGAIAFSVEGIHADALAYRLYNRGVIVSLGGGREQRLEEILKARGVAIRESACAISLMFSPSHSEEMVEKLSLIIQEEVMILKKCWSLA